MRELLLATGITLVAGGIALGLYAVKQIKSSRPRR